MKDNYKVHELDDVIGRDYYMVETLTQFIVYQHLYDTELRIKRWKVSKDLVPIVEDAIVLWVATLN